MAKSERMYKDSPSLKRDEGGKVKVEKPKKEEKKEEPAVGEKSADNEDAGLEGNPLPHDGEGSMEVHHMHERHELHHKHVSEHLQMHRRHEVEHSSHKGEKGELHKKHESEHKAMLDRHHEEFKQMHSRHGKSAPSESKE